MTTNLSKRLWVLVAILFLGMGSVFILPQQEQSGRANRPCSIT